MIKKSCLLVVNSALLFTGSTQGFLPVTEEVEFDTNALQATADVVDYSKEEKGLRDQVFTERIAQINTPINLEYNDFVKKHILRLLENKKHCKKLIQRSTRYFPIFDQVFTESNVPDAINCLSIIESHLIVDAKSPVGAKGLWQFMPNTARQFDLQVNDDIDQRMDVYASTQAAAAFLNQLHKRYDDWLLALAAYNCGPGNVNKAIKRAGGKTDFWEIREYLPRETREYVPKFIATVYLMNFHTDHGIAVELSKENKPLSKAYDLEVSESESIWNFINDNGLDIAEVKNLNSGIKNWHFNKLKKNIIFHVPNIETEEPFLLNRFPSDFAYLDISNPIEIQENKFDVLYSLS